MSIVEITPQELLERQKAGAITLLDVRTPAEFEEIHVAFASLAPLDSFDPARVLGDKLNSAEPVYVICRSGSRGKMACEKLLAAGRSQVFNIQGGTLACAQAGLPIIRGRKTISLERQVRISAGLLVAVGSALAWFVDPLWCLLPGFVGCGLVFAGVTDTCGMGMMLAKMPWNQRPGAACCNTKP